MNRGFAADGSRAPRVGLVLGGGGTVGAAYHAGALAALEHDLGWDARDADVIVGTSAGSIVGSLLRLGVPPRDLAALTVGAPAHDISAALAARLRDRPVFPPMTLRHFLRIPRLPTPAMMFGLAQLTMTVRHLSAGALSMVLPEGREQLSPYLAFLDEVGSSYSAAPLRICAVRRDNWHRRVFDPAAGAAPLSSIVAASCAVPGYFASVPIDGHVYVDGGAVSATNADVLRRHDIDLAVVVSPMTGRGRRASALGWVRRQCRATLDRELARLARHGIPAVVVEPGAAVLEHVSLDFMSDAALTEIVRTSFFDTGAQIARSPALRSLDRRLVGHGAGVRVG